MITDINSEDRLVQQTFAKYLCDDLGWESVYAWNDETFGPTGTLGRGSEREAVLTRDLRAALRRLNPALPDVAIEEAVQKLTRHDFARDMLQHNREFYRYIRDGVPVSYRDDKGEVRHAQARVLDFRNPANNRFLAVRELKIQGLRTPHYNRRADLVCFVNGLPLVFFELKAVYVNIRAAYDGNLSDYRDTIPHAFYHNAFLVVSNGDRARYGSITSPWEFFYEWKRNDERDRGSADARVLLDGMLAKERLLDLVENFILFDDSKPGRTRKVVARNQQVLGVNNSVASVIYQEELKDRIPLEERLRVRVATMTQEVKDAPPEGAARLARPPKTVELPLVERAHPDLGRLGVFWHTQGSGKSYSMVFFAEKVRRVVRGNFTFVIMTDRHDLDKQIYKTFVGCGAADENTPRAATGEQLEALLKQDHRYVFSLIHKFNREVSPHAPYSRRDDIIVLSDEAHRTQGGKLARNMRQALPNAAFLGFTGTPLFKQDHLTKRIFGYYVSRYDFKRSEEDGATVKLVYENRGEKLGLARLDLNDRIAEVIEQADLDADQEAHLEKLLGKDYEVITADDRLENIAKDFVEHCTTRWESGKSMLVCIDKITCARMYQLILPLWRAKGAELRARAAAVEGELAAATEPDDREKLARELDRLRRQAAWVEETILGLIISEGQNEVRDFKAWGFDIIPHREIMKRGFETLDGRRVDVETAFKDPQHPFRVGVVCAMWLTGFDVECLSTLYIDKPLKAHTLMQAIARANRVYPGKSCGVIVDYNGVLQSLRAALAQYALGDDQPAGGDELLAPLEQMVLALVQAIDETEDHLRGLGFDPGRLVGAKGFDQIEVLRDAVNALYTSEAARRRFEILARQVFERFRALLTEPSIYQYAVRRDNLETIYRKLEERRDTADVTCVLKELHRIVNEAIRAQAPGDDQAVGLTVDLSQIDFQRLRDEFAARVARKSAVLEEIRALVERKLQALVQQNPDRMDYYRKYQTILADYNREKDRATVEQTFAQLLDLAALLDAEERRAAEEGLSKDELALFDLLFKENISKADREKLKQASRGLLASLQEVLGRMDRWTEKEQTQAEVRVFILDRLCEALPNPPYSPEETERVAGAVYQYVWQRSTTGQPLQAPTAA
ncbi:MAG: type I restriction endonuclease subunit R [Gemmataceae bacterium]|nr:type I restriction endonuclease subunit R [Gemmataceae bacterium]